MYRTLHEKHFEFETALIFAQLHSELPYLAPSHLNGKFSVLINCDYEARYKGFVEHLLDHVTQNLAYKPDKCTFLTRLPDQSVIDELKVGKDEISVE